MTAVARLRLAIKKDNALQFLSHLDFARAVRLIVIRADLPVLYSEGFNPHMKLSFASALGVGVAADEEFMDLELAKEIPVDDVMARMNEKSPLGFAENISIKKHRSSWRRPIMPFIPYAAP